MNHRCVKCVSAGIPVFDTPLRKTASRGDADIGLSAAVTCRLQTSLE